MNRRESLQVIGLAAAGLMFPKKGTKRSDKTETDFRFCLNTSTIRGQNLGLRKDIEIAARAGYDSLELWVRDVQEYLDDGNSLTSLNRYIRDTGLEVANAIGFAPWLSDIDEVSEWGFSQMREEMEMLASIGCTRIAAAPAGEFEHPELNLFEAGEKYSRLLDLGRETGVTPQLEFWGPSPVLFHMGQIMMAAAVANDPEACLLPDVYHLFRGGSGFESLKMLQGNMIEVFHINDYPGDKPREDQTDADRIYPGDGAAPMKQIYADLKAMGGIKYLSLELFNRTYWQQDALEVARTGLEKMKQFV
jgi:2-keto-myo-inositol isomerase